MASSDLEWEVVDSIKRFLERPRSPNSRYSTSISGSDNDSDEPINTQPGGKITEIITLLLSGIPHGKNDLKDLLKELGIDIWQCRVASKNCRVTDRPPRYTGFFVKVLEEGFGLLVHHFFIEVLNS